MKYFALIIYLLFFTNCKSSIDIFLEPEIKSTHSINNVKMFEIIDYFLNDSNFKNWSDSDKKVLLISSNNIVIRAIPTFKKKHAIPFLDNNFSAYLVQKDILIIYWGDENIFLKKNKGVKKKKIFDKSVLKKIKNGDFYGCDFQIEKGNLKLLEKGYLNSILIDFRDSN